MKTRRQCSVCAEWFDSEDGLVSCSAHSFGERDDLLASKEETHGD